jgi:hypothetical protein
VAVKDDVPKVVHLTVPRSHIRQLSVINKSHRWPLCGLKVALCHERAVGGPKRARGGASAHLHEGILQRQGELSDDAQRLCQI